MIDFIITCDYYVSLLCRNVYEISIHNNILYSIIKPNFSVTVRNWLIVQFFDTCMILYLFLSIFYSNEKYQFMALKRVAKLHGYHSLTVGWKYKSRYSLESIHWDLSSDAMIFSYLHVKGFFWLHFTKKIDIFVDSPLYGSL